MLLFWPRLFPAEKSQVKFKKDTLRILGRLNAQVAAQSLSKAPRAGLPRKILLDVTPAVYMYEIESVSADRFQKKQCKRKKLFSKLFSDFLARLKKRFRPKSYKCGFSRRQKHLKKVEKYVFF
jgi:hypothetical protein